MGDDASQRSLGREVSQLRAIVESLAARAERQDRISEILATADLPAPPPPPAVPKPRTPASQRWLHVVRGAAIVPLAAAAGFTRAHARYVAASAAGAALLTGGTLAPDVITSAPASQLPGHHHAAVHHHHRAFTPVPPGMPALRKRRRSDNDEAVKPGPAVPPSASPAPAGPDPSPAAVPDPVPAPLPTTPVPDPTCTALHPGKNCHGGDVAGDVVRVPGHLPGLAWDDMPGARETMLP